ncbi:MAG: NTP transferase domain-containing protein [Candidatus Nealsonbacteria bacterium]|nr:NTP transferase domain-containing protein [Candidatus Nealsonbacteria bacterium]
MQAVILAAGQSSRFWPLNYQRKSLIRVLGKPLIFYTAEALKKLGIKEIIIVQGQERDAEKSLSGLGIKNIRYVVQSKSLGTGDALLSAGKLIKNDFVLLGPAKADLSLYLPSMLKRFQKTKGKIVFLGAKTKRPEDFGMARLKAGKIIEIVENPRSKDRHSDIKTSELYFIPKDFVSCLKKIKKSEDSLIGAFNLFIKDRGGELVIAKQNPLSLKYPWEALRTMNFLLNSKNLENKISLNAKICKNTVIKGNVFIDSGAEIGDNTVIFGPCYVGKNCKIGANNVIRGPVNLEEETITGAFSEIKNSLFQEGSHIHSGYFGDMVIGRNCRFGAGFVSGNRRLDRGEIFSMVKGKKIGTGLTYFGGAIGDSSRFGIHVSMMPGALIGSDSNIGPHSLILENIPDNAVFYNKFNSVIKKNDRKI